MSAPDRSPFPADRLDPSALRRLRQRLLTAEQTPWLHTEVARRMAERLPLILRVPERVLDWSGDAQAIAPVLRSACPKAQLIQVVEYGAPQPEAPSWWRRLTRSDLSRPHSVAADLAATAQAQLLWSNMRLHFEPDPSLLLAAWRAALAPDGFVMYSTLGPGSLRLLRDLYARMGWGIPHAPFVDMHDLGDMMVEAGFADPVMDQESLYLTYRTPEALLAELHTLGANLDPGRFNGLRTPRWHAKLLSALKETAAPDGRIGVEFELVYGHAFRAPDRGPAVTEQTAIGLDAMKLMLRKSKPPR